MDENTSMQLFLYVEKCSNEVHLVEVVVEEVESFADVANECE